MLTNPYQAYQQNMVGTVSPEQLVLMLYNGALRFLKQAQKDNFSTISCRTQEIVCQVHPSDFYYLSCYSAGVSNRWRDSSCFLSAVPAIFIKVNVIMPARASPGTSLTANSHEDFV